jgi:hypothetical protein
MLVMLSLHVIVAFGLANFERYLKEVIQARERTMNYIRDIASERFHERDESLPPSIPLTRYYQSLALRQLAHALSNVNHSFPDPDFANSSKFYVHLYYLRLVPAAPDSPYADDFRCFELRMKPFWTVEHPSIALYHDFEVELYPFGPYDSRSPIDKERNDAFHNDTEELLRAAKEATSALIEYSEKNGNDDKASTSVGRSVQSLTSSRGLTSR